jgi:hypothetical protein
MMWEQKYEKSSAEQNIILIFYPAFFPRCALKASPTSPSDSRPLSKDSKYAEMEKVRDFSRKFTKKK